MLLQTNTAIFPRYKGTGFGLESQSDRQFISRYHTFIINTKQLHHVDILDRFWVAITTGMSFADLYAIDKTDYF